MSLERPSRGAHAVLVAGVLIAACEPSKPSKPSWQQEEDDYYAQFDPPVTDLQPTKDAVKLCEAVVDDDSVPGTVRAQDESPEKPGVHQVSISRKYKVDHANKGAPDDKYGKYEEAEIDCMYTAEARVQPGQKLPKDEYGFVSLPTQDARTILAIDTQTRVLRTISLPDLCTSEACGGLRDGSFIPRQATPPDGMLDSLDRLSKTQAERRAAQAAYARWANLALGRVQAEQMRR